MVVDIFIKSLVIVPLLIPLLRVNIDLYPLAFSFVPDLYHQNQKARNAVRPYRNINRNEIRHLSHTFTI